MPAKMYNYSSNLKIYWMKDYFLLSIYFLQFDVQFRIKNLPISFYCIDYLLLYLNLFLN
jgi:hypothetical protein